ncbi:unnamed protein product [Boreogadus saida]
MSLTVRAPGADRNHTAGLCGSFDGRPDNDLHSAGGNVTRNLHAFISEWRLPPGTSLFDTVPSNRDAPKPAEYCRCQPEPRLSPPFIRTHSRPAGSSDCSRHGNVALSSVIPALDVTAEYVHSVEPAGGLPPRNRGSDPLATPRDGASTRPRHPGNRGRRQSQRSPSDPPRQSLSQADLGGHAYFFPEDHEPAPPPPDAFSGPPPTPAWPAPSGLTQRQARASCRRAVAGSGLALGCGALLGEAFVGRAVAMCVSDLQLKDDPGWLNATLPLLENECERRLVEERRSEGEHRGAVELLRCPGRCGGNGQCAAWGCRCFPGFGSYDCSSVSAQIPEIAELEAQGLCDVRRGGGCSVVLVGGAGFKRSRQLKCEFVREKFEEGEWVLLDDPRFVQATFLDATALECRLPLEDSQVTAGSDPVMSPDRPLARWQVKVSNDGHGYSNAKVLTVYDGGCQRCSSTAEGRCVLKGLSLSWGVGEWQQGEADGNQLREGEQLPSPGPVVTPEELGSQNNQPPVVQPVPPGLQSFQGERFQYQLRARDPEGSSVVFSLASGPGETAALSPSGLLSWAADDPGADGAEGRSFRVSVADKCGAETQVSVQVFVTPCGCGNGGSCVSRMEAVAGGGAYVCVCPDGFAGGRCGWTWTTVAQPLPLAGASTDPTPSPASARRDDRQHLSREDVDECASAPCYPGASCQNTPVSFGCGRVRAVTPRRTRPYGPGASPQGWGRTRAPRCLSSGLPRVRCLETAPGANGFACGPCPAVLHGDGFTCSQERLAVQGSTAGRGPSVSRRQVPPSNPTIQGRCLLIQRS